MSINPFGHSSGNFKLMFFLKVPLQSQKTLLHFISEWEIKLYSEQNYFRLGASTQVIIQEQLKNSNNPSAFSLHRHTEMRGTRVSSSEWGSEARFALWILPPLALPSITKCSRHEKMWKATSYLNVQVCIVEAQTIGSATQWPKYARLPIWDSSLWFLHKRRNPAVPGRWDSSECEAASYPWRSRPS